MTVARLRAEMPAIEFAGWLGFLQYENWQREEAKHKR